MKRSSKENFLFRSSICWKTAWEKLISGEAEQADGEENNLRFTERVRGGEKEGVIAGVLPFRTGGHADLREDAMTKKTVFVFNMQKSRRKPDYK